MVKTSIDILFTTIIPLKYNNQTIHWCDYLIEMYSKIIIDLQCYLK